MVNHHGFSITELEALIPFERDIYVSMINDQEEKKKKDAEGQ